MNKDLEESIVDSILECAKDVQYYGAKDVQYYGAKDVQYYNQHITKEYITNNLVHRYYPAYISNYQTMLDENYLFCIQYAESRNIMCSSPVCDNNYLEVDLKNPQATIRDRKLNKLLL